MKHWMYYRFDHQNGKLMLSDWMKFQKSFPYKTNNFVDKMCAYKKVSVTELFYHRGQNDVLLIQLIVWRRDIEIAFSAMSRFWD